jgi:hypothetical protein
MRNAMSEPNVRLKPCNFDVRKENKKQRGNETVNKLTKMSE